VKYDRVFFRLGTAYGIGDGATTFNLPDMYGRTWVGQEIPGFSTQRMEVHVTIASSATDTLTVAAGATAPLRIGMGAFGHSQLTGQTIIALTDTTIQLSASVGSGISGSVRFSKLGNEDAQTRGAGGTGMSSGRRIIKVQKMGCTAAASTQLTVGDLNGLRVGQTVAGSGISGAPTIVAIRSATVVDLSSSQTVTLATLTFFFAAPECDDERLERNAELSPVIANCSLPTDSNMTEGSGTAEIDVPAGLTALLFCGMHVTGTGVPDDTYITDIVDGNTIRVTSKTLAAAMTTASGVTLTFTYTSVVRASVAQTPDTLPATVGNWVIKT
jgi:hypothetical protein